MAGSWSKVLHVLFVLSIFLFFDYCEAGGKPPPPREYFSTF